MFYTYPEIFNQRGKMYHQAMLKYPWARKSEFDYAIQFAKLEAGQILCDIPSGGSYISTFLNPKVKLLSIETSAEFMQCAQSHPNETALICEDLGNISLLSNTIDRVISLAGSHHLEDKHIFYNEVHRILKPTGVFCLADVRKDSEVDGFLNTFVNQNSSMGHQGDFLTEATAETLSSIGFKITHDESIKFYWIFESLLEMIDFCRLLFGIDQASESDILKGIQEYLGYEIIEDKYYLNWELYFFQAIKPLVQSSL